MLFHYKFILIVLTYKSNHVTKENTLIHSFIKKETSFEDRKQISETKLIGSNSHACLDGRVDAMVVVWIDYRNQQLATLLLHSHFLAFCVT